MVAERFGAHSICEDTAMTTTGLLINLGFVTGLALAILTGLALA
ncbi:hypothetical protein [Jannaschia aquimarina]|nr:hypothetical protein [Jannaschia aquimarina]